MEVSSHFPEEWKIGGLKSQLNQLAWTWCKEPLAWSCPRRWWCLPSGSPRRRAPLYPPIQRSQSGRRRGPEARAASGWQEKPPEQFLPRDGALALRCPLPRDGVWGCLGYLEIHHGPWDEHLHMRAGNLQRGYRLTYWIQPQTQPSSANWVIWAKTCCLLVRGQSDYFGILEEPLFVQYYWQMF